MPDLEDRKAGFHHRLYPYMNELVQYATERGPDEDPWIVRDRAAALRNERQGRGKALVRIWVPTDWVSVNDVDGEDNE